MTALDALLNRLDALRERYEADARKAITAYLQSATTAKAAIVRAAVPAVPARKLHWTKRPENAAKTRAWKRTMIKARRRATS